MLQVALQYLFEKVAKPEIIPINGKNYTTMSVQPVKESEPASIPTGTLTGLVNYITFNPDKLDPGTLFLNVTAHNNVVLRGAIRGDFNQRFAYLTAHLPEESPFPWGRFQDIEEFIIAIQSRFVQDESTQSILQFVSSIKDEHVKTSQDDGISQTVTAKVGIARVAEVTVPNPVVLQPYRTFPEIEQPKSKFVFRMRSGTDLPTCALFEGDGGRWKVDAIFSIREYLQNALPEVTIVA